MSDRRWYPPTKPHAVADGIRARTARGAIGSSWWSRRFLDVLESFALGTRLTRGRSYARKGQVISLEISPGRVQAQVQGSRRTPYRVSISLAPFPEIVWAKAEIALSEQALPSAKLLAGEVPPELEDIFAGAGAPLFPQRMNDLDQRCNCPDAAVPCKHLAATFYLLAEAFDDDPFLILRWRGRDRESLLARLRELRSDVPSGEPDSDGGVATETAGTALALADLPVPDISWDRFWLPPVPLPVRPPTLPVDVDVILRQLAVPAADLGGQALVDSLIDAYQRLGAADPELSS